jgi:hypothetical protein
MEGTSVKMERQSPVHLPGKPKNENAGSLAGDSGICREGPGPWVIDLSHCRRWDIQGRDWGDAWPPGFSFPILPEVSSGMPMD